MRVVSSAYLRSWIFVLEILIPACASFNLAFCMMYSAYMLNKLGDNIHHWRTPFPMWNQSVVPYLVLTVASCRIQISQEASQVVWYSHLFQNFPQFIVIHIVKGFGIVNKAEIDVFRSILNCYFPIFWNLHRSIFAFWQTVPMIWELIICTELWCDLIETSPLVGQCQPYTKT